MSNSNHYQYNWGHNDEYRAPTPKIEVPAYAGLGGLPSSDESPAPPIEDPIPESPQEASVSPQGGNPPRSDEDFSLDLGSINMDPMLFLSSHLETIHGHELGRVEKGSIEGIDFIILWIGSDWAKRQCVVALDDYLDREPGMRQIAFYSHLSKQMTEPHELIVLESRGIEPRPKARFYHPAVLKLLYRIDDLEAPSVTFKSLSAKLWPYEMFQVTCEPSASTSQEQNEAPEQRRPSSHDPTQTPNQIFEICEESIARGPRLDSREEFLAFCAAYMFFRGHQKKWIPLNNRTQDAILTVLGPGWSIKSANRKLLSPNSPFVEGVHYLAYRSKVFAICVEQILKDFPA